MFVGNEEIYHTSILKAEALAALRAVQIATKYKIGNLIVEGDNLTIINVIRRLWKIPWEIHTIINDVYHFLRYFQDFKNFHCYREANSAADRLVASDIHIDWVKAALPFVQGTHLPDTFIRTLRLGFHSTPASVALLDFIRIIRLDDLGLPST